MEGSIEESDRWDWLKQKEGTIPLNFELTTDPSLNFDDPKCIYVMQVFVYREDGKDKVARYIYEKLEYETTDETLAFWSLYKLLRSDEGTFLIDDHGRLVEFSRNGFGLSEVKPLSLESQEQFQNFHTNKAPVLWQEVNSK